MLDLLDDLEMSCNNFIHSYAVYRKALSDSFQVPDSLKDMLYYITMLKEDVETALKVIK